MKPPEKLDNANVILWTWSGPDPFFIMPDGECGIPIYGLAICQYAHSNTVYRLSCDKNWHVQNDSDHNSVEEARTALSDQHEISNIKWEKF